MCHSITDSVALQISVGSKFYAQFYGIPNYVDVI